MKTYLIPIDFSEASAHAAEYAAALSHQTDVEHIVLLNAYYVSVYESTLPNPDMVPLLEEEIEKNAAERIEKLESLKKKLAGQVRASVKLSVHLNRSHLVDAVVENAYNYHADLVILGSTGNTSAGDYTAIGSHVVQISKASPVPVIIVPFVYKFKAISKVAIACDFEKINERFPLEALQQLLHNRKLNLLVVNIDDEAKHSGKDAERMAEETALHEMLKPYSPEYHYIDATDVIAGILQFAAAHQVELVIALPHQYSFLHAIVHTSVSRKLAELSKVPVLLLK